MWGVQVLRQKVCLLRQLARGAAAAPRLDDLRCYLALFFGELLVQFHVKEEALAGLAGVASARAARHWTRGLAELIELLKARAERNHERCLVGRTGGRPDPRA